MNVATCEKVKWNRSGVAGEKGCVEALFSLPFNHYYSIFKTRYISILIKIKINFKSAMNTRLFLAKIYQANVNNIREKTQDDINKKVNFKVKSIKQDREVQFIVIKSQI